MNVAIIEDERKLAGTLVEGLTQEGYEAEAFSDGESFIAAVDTGKSFDLAILDLRLPGVSGNEVSSQLRARHNQIPILVLTAHDTVADKVTALDSGADDFLAKPFNFEELMARLRALGRRVSVAGSPSVTLNGLVLDLPTRTAIREGRSIELTPTEFDLLYLLIQHRGRPLSREEISKALWDVRDQSLSNIVDVHISNLRKKVDGTYDSKLISTIRGRGYQIA